MLGTKHKVIIALTELTGQKDNIIIEAQILLSTYHIQIARL